MGETCQPRTVNIDGVNVEIIIDIGMENNFAPIGMPRRFAVYGRELGKASYSSPINVRYKEIMIAGPIRHKDDLRVLK